MQKLYFFIKNFLIDCVLQGRVSESMIHVVDWLPTILALAGGQANTTFLDGMDQSLHLTAG